MKPNFKKVNDLLSKLGIDLSLVSIKAEDTIYYPNSKSNGRKIVYKQFRLKNFVFKDNEISKLRNDICIFALHEIGHFIITPKQRRQRKDYGIPDNNRNFKYSLEEVKATMIENELRRLFGFPYRKNLYDGSNVDEFFISDNKKLILNWWNSEGKLLAKTYADLA